MFRNEYVAEREEKQAVMEQHVQLSNVVISSAETQGNDRDYFVGVNTGVEAGVGVAAAVRLVGIITNIVQC